jgi:TRAP-type mannitol/chloroaromatic compound transport system permease large subunit
METGDYFVIAMFLSFIGFLFTGFPVAWVLGGVAVLFTLIATISDTWFGTMTGLDYITLGMSVNRIFKYMDNWVLVALPMFIFMGLMLDKSGIAEKMMESMQELFGKIHGGLAVTVTLIGIVLAASTGIIGASVVLLGRLSLPAMTKQGYSKTLALGTIASAGTLGILIPPSIMLVIMAAYNKRLNFSVIVDVMKGCFNTTAYIFAIFLGATTFALVLRCLGGDEFIERILTGIPFGPYGILTVILAVSFCWDFFWTGLKSPSSSCP